jgi:HEAT repeat protein
MNWKQARVAAAAVFVLSLIVSLGRIHAGPTPRTVSISEQDNPFEHQISQQVRKLKDPSSTVRTSAAEALGYLRAYSAAPVLISALSDVVPQVRRAAAMSLGWSGGRPAVQALLDALDDRDWSVAQAANVALKNLTGMDFPFNALGDTQTRSAQSDLWRQWWTNASREQTPSAVVALLSHENLEDRLRGVRALGAIAGADVAPKILEILNTYTSRPAKPSGAGAGSHCVSVDLTNTERQLAEASLRALGRLRAPESLPVLIGLLNHPMWARFAADALGDFGSPEAVSPMISVYSRFSYALDDHQGRTRLPELCPADDVEIAYSTDDRMMETPYAIMQALSRLPLEGHEEELRKIAPYIVANIPSDFDGGIVYEPEAWQLITAFLLDKANLREAACDAVFRAAAESEKWFSARVIRERTRTPRGRAALDQVEEQSGLGTLPSAGKKEVSPAPQKPDNLSGLAPEEAFYRLATQLSGDGPSMPSDDPYMTSWLPCLCAERSDIRRLLPLLDNDNGWIRINAVKALMFADAKEAVEPIAQRLAGSHPEADYGFSGALEVEEYQDPAPRWRDVLIRALGHFQARQYDDLVIHILDDDRNVVDTQYAAAQTLDQLGTPKAIAALQRAATHHPFRSVREVAQEALWRRGIKSSGVERPAAAPPSGMAVETAKPATQKLPEKYVFIRGENTLRSDWNTEAGLDPWRVTSTLTNPGPTTREGRNLYILSLEGGSQKVTPLTNFANGFVADCEVSWDGKKVIFARRQNDDPHNYANLPYSPARLLQPGEFQLDGRADPWWHIWEINADGTGLHQITHGPYHDVQPAYLPDNRIVFSTSRLGLRDEYHMYTATGLAVMKRDGSDIRVIGLNLGADRDPSVLPDGRIVFARLDVFYSRLKTELALQATYPDGTHNVSIYGPERRAIWTDLSRKHSYWAMLPSSDNSDPDNRNRVLKIGQPQGLPDGRIVAVSPAGLVVVGPGSTEERLVPHDRRYAVTSPFPIGDGTKVVAAATIQQFKIGNRILDAESAELQEYRRKTRYGYQFADAVNIDLGLYIIDLESGAMTQLYNDPNFAEFEPRPLVARPVPPMLPERYSPPGTFTGRMLAMSAFITRPQDDRVRTRGELVRVIEGQPFVTRRETNKSIHADGKFRWKNHGGTLARVLGTFPLAADGSFYLDVPADRLLQLQILDSDRQVVGNETFWNYTRPGETKACIGCHESPDISVPTSATPLASMVHPLAALPHEGDFTYRAKVWLKGKLPDAVEERTRTVRAVNLIGRN